MPCPNNLADGLVAPALHEHKIANIDAARTEEPRAMGMDVIGTRHLRVSPAWLADETPSNWESHMQNFAGEQSVLCRRVGLDVQDVCPRETI
jgi:hypothetical protein